MRRPYSLLIFAAAVAAHVEKFDKNLVFRSPFFGEHQVSLESHLLMEPSDNDVLEFAHDTVAISRRNHQPARRDTVDASHFKDAPYPGFYTSDFSNVRVSLAILLIMSKDGQGASRLELRCQLHAFWSVPRSTLVAFGIDVIVVSCKRTQI